MLLVTKAAFISLQSTRKEKVSKQNLPYSFYQRQGILLGLFFLLLWFVFDYTNLDYWVSAQVFDFKNHNWIYAQNFWIKQVGYYGIKDLLITYAILLIAMFVSSFWWQKTRPYRMILFFLILCIALVPAEIAFLKQTFYKPRPEQVIAFGGTMPHVDLFATLPNELSATNWPGGHASGGAALMSWYFIGWTYSRRWGWVGFGVGLLVSNLMGWSQILRGQHFLSHNLWTLWFAWITILLIHYLLFKKNSLAKRKRNSRYFIGSFFLQEFILKLSKREKDRLY